MAGNRLRRSLGRTVVAAILALVWLSGCGDGTGPPPPPDSVIVSNPVPVAAAAGFNASLRSATGNAVGEDLVYVALAPGTVPAGQLATVRKVGATNTVTASIIAGGLDPVPVVAGPGDNIEIVVTGAGAAPISFTMAVPARRRPVVVRADPPPRKRDVPLNTAIVIVFNEPVASASLASGVQLFRGNTPVAGTVELLGGTATAAVFRADGNLDPNTDYRLVASTGVRDLTGDPLAANVSVEFTTGTMLVGSANRVSVLPDTAAVAIGSHVQLIATAQDTNGTVIVGRPVSWSVDNPAVATVSSTGLVTALAIGVAHLQAELDGRRAVATVLVSASLAPVESVEVSPGSATVVIGGLVQLTTVLRDAAGNIVRFRPVAWRSSNPSVASVSEAAGGTAVVLGLTGGTATITATSEGKAGTATITMGTVGPYAQISAGSVGTCAVTTSGQALCWGGGPGHSGILGNGTGIPTVVPAAVAGGLKFSQASVAVESACGVTPAADAFCWGYNGSGEVGTGDTTYGYLSPVAVAGNLKYSAVDGSGINCGLTTPGQVYCWGSSNFGGLGLGASTTQSRVPGAVLGGFTFAALAVGGEHACALTSSGAAYCWGRGDAGAVGDSTRFDRFEPARVAGGLTFVALSAGGYHTCGLTSDGTAYCWGVNDHGELGVGSAVGPQSPCQSPTDPLRGFNNCSGVPVRVLTSLHFASISGGDSHTCALTSTGASYCWGDNSAGQLGDGSTTPGLTPVAVKGGLTFARLSAGGNHTCALTAAGTAYCWGANWAGQLGDGTTTDSSVPVKVAGQP